MDVSTLSWGTPDVITDGMIWMEPISNILTKHSCDGANPTASNSKDDDSYDWEMPWSRVLANKRNDSDYWATKASIEKYGFVRPVTVTIEIGTDNDYEYGDGHHRLAAAIELGFTHIPVEAYDGGYNISDDSGMWDGTIEGAYIDNPAHYN